jgi:hypothetical protein
MIDLIADFQAEHVFAQDLYSDPDIKAFLESNGNYGDSALIN